MDNLKFHHIGVATKCIEKELKQFEKLGYKPISDIFVDDVQKIKGLFISAPGQPCLELLENSTDDGPLNGLLNQGVKFYHFAYETNNMEQLVASMVDDGAFVIVPITKATYFEKICFLMLRNKMIVEIVQPY